MSASVPVYCVRPAVYMISTNNFLGVDVVYPCRCGNMAYVNIFMGYHHFRFTGTLCSGTDRVIIVGNPPRVISSWNLVDGMIGTPS